MTIEAHDQALTLHLLCHIPAHEPREGDKHYHLFNAAKRRMRKAGLLVCAIHGCTYPGPIELHHAKIEYSLAGGIDIARFSEMYGLHLDDESFTEYVESEGNLEPLCPVHHRTHFGIHAIPEPLWQALRVWRADMAPPVENLAGSAAVA
jgi:hypothetical protein